MRLVVGEGSCGLAAGAGGVYEQLESLLAQDNPTGVELGITGCIRVSPLHCHDTSDIDDFLRVTAEIAALARK